MKRLTAMFDDPRRAQNALYVILALAFVIRLWNLTAPIADRHSWNQISAATVMRHFALDGVDFLHPQWDVLETDSTAPRIEAEEAPIYHTAAALLARVFGPVVPIARLLSILASLLAAWWLFRLTARHTDPLAGLLAATFFSLAPFAWFFGRAVMSDMWMLAMLILAVERFDAWLGEDSLTALLTSALAVALAGLFKPFALHIGLALLMMQVSRKGARSLVDPRLVLFAGVAIVPPLLWVWHAAQVGSLGNVVGTGESFLTSQKIWGPLSLLWTGDFWMTVQARIFDQMATPIVTGLAVVALIGKENRRPSATALFWLAAAMAYLLLVRDGNRMHNYYQLPFLPPLAMLAGIGGAYLARRFDVRITLALTLIFAVWATATVRSHFRLDTSSVEAGLAVREVSLPGELIVAVDPGVTKKNQVIYYAHRRGWHERAVKDDFIATYRRRGVKWVVTVLDGEQAAHHPEWLKRLSALPVIAEKAQTGAADLPPDKRHLIQIYRLD